MWTEVQIKCHRFFQCRLLFIHKKLVERCTAMLNHLIKIEKIEKKQMFSTVAFLLV